MFQHHDHRGTSRKRHRDLRTEIDRHLREELRGTRRHGAGRGPASFREMFSQGRHGPQMRRGEIRPRILAVLQQKPLHGYEVIQELEGQSGGRWRPSAGSVYPTLQQLADEGLATSTEVDGRRTYTLTDDGRKAAESGTRSPWPEADDDQRPDVMRLVMELGSAAAQVNKVGSARTRSEAARILTDARRQMYRLLSEDEDASTDDVEAEPA